MLNMRERILICKCGKPALEKGGKCRDCRNAYQRHYNKLYREKCKLSRNHQPKNAHETFNRTEDPKQKYIYDEQVNIMVIQKQAEEKQLRELGFNPDKIMASEAEKILNNSEISLGI